MRFRNREHAAHLLAEKLSAYRGQHPLVLGIPRGAVPMAKIIAEALDGDLDVVLVHKLGAPGNPEFAIGSVDERGQVYLSDAVRELEISDRYIEQEKHAQLQTLHKRRAQYTPVRPPLDPAGRLVIVVDNGIATGASMIAALRAVRAQQPKKLIAAVAVAPPETVARIRAEADEVVCLSTPDYFYAVGQFFEDFSQVTDEQAIAMLRESCARATVSA
ncbi:MAG TPA: phosphoribosyltransferase family protein [Methylomirabilota bacterium]|nr:phosphoribosyltransferase family protein [Methylomirabilota bacterium]